MMLMNNQYKKIEDDIENISKIEVITDNNNKIIEDLEIKDEDLEPNIIIYYKVYEKRSSVINIYYSVKIIITDVDGFNENIEDIINLENIEYIIVEKRIYKKTKDKFEYIDLIEDVREKIEIIKDKIKNDEYNIVNTNNSNLLHYLGYFMMYEEMNEIIDKMDDKIINIINKNGNSVFDILCDKDNEFGVYEELKKLMIKIVNKLDKKIINRKNKNNINNLMCLCYNGSNDIIKEIIDYFDEEIFYERDNNNISALYLAIYNYMEDVGIMIIDKIEDEEKRRELINLEINNKKMIEISIYRRMERLSIKMLEYIERDYIIKNREKLLNMCKNSKMDNLYKKI